MEARGEDRRGLGVKAFTTEATEVRRGNGGQCKWRLRRRALCGWRQEAGIEEGQEHRQECLCHFLAGIEEEATGARCASLADLKLGHYKASVGLGMRHSRWS
jgi:hypothetical protein